MLLELLRHIMPPVPRTGVVLSSELLCGELFLLYIYYSERQHHPIIDFYRNQFVNFLEILENIVIFTMMMTHLF